MQAFTWEVISEYHRWLTAVRTVLPAMVVLVVLLLVGVVLLVEVVGNHPSSSGITPHSDVKPHTHTRHCP